ncbi:MAG: RNA-binding S4 domain-containing protein [Rhodospirillaceae bacterium]
MPDRTTDGRMGDDGIRLDKWLWHARFFRSRSLASRVCAAGRVRVGGAVVAKAHYLVRVGDVLTFPQARDIRVVRIEALGARRGSPAEARGLYSEIPAQGGPPAGA